MRKKTANRKSFFFLLEQTVQSQKTITYLGVLLDTKLSWNKQIITNKVKALKSIGGLGGLAGSAWKGKLPRMQ